MSDSIPAVSAPTITVRDGRTADAREMAHLMYTEISWGRLRDFGMGFLTLLHRAFCTSRHAVCVVAEIDGRVVGYAASVLHVGRFYREFAILYGVPAAVLILPKLFRRNMLATFWRGLTYGKDPGDGGSQCEVLTFAVASGFSGRGIGTMILKATMEKLRQRGAEAIRMGTIAEDNSVAFAMYSKLGFKFVSTRQFYGDTKVHVMEYRFDSTSQ